MRGWMLKQDSDWARRSRPSPCRLSVVQVLDTQLEHGVLEIRNSRSYRNACFHHAQVLDKQLEQRHASQRQWCGQKYRWRREPGGGARLCAARARRRREPDCALHRFLPMWSDLYPTATEIRQRGRFP